MKQYFLLSNMVKVSSTNLNQIEGRAVPVVIYFPSKQHKKMLAKTDPTGEPMSIPSVYS